jgi:tetratricopeptide (TPR) repeat protein/predicted aspartyl protease
MKLRRLTPVLLSVALATPGARSFAAPCKVDRLAELPVTMAGLRPTVAAKINGADATFIADSGAFYSMISTAAAAEFGLTVEPLPFDLIVWGTNGSMRASYTTVKSFTLANIPLKKVELIVGGSAVGDSEVGLLGQNILRIADVEYDLANGVIRLMRPTDCNKTVMAYWADNKPYSVIDINWATPQQPHTRGFAYVNGAKISVMFDTGAAQSVLTTRAASRAGVRPDGEGVRSAGVSRGIGRKSIATWIGPFASFKIGDEEIRNTRLRFGDLSLDTDMLIGADFFLSHRVYVASSQRKLYFTYNGGPVFNLQSVPATPLDSPGAAPPTQTASAAPAVPGSAVGGPKQGGPSTPPGDTAAAGEAGAVEAAEFPPAVTAAPPAAGSPLPKEISDQDAASFARRGAAYTSRRDYARAIADLTRACELAPSEPQYFYERGVARRENHQLFEAMADFDQALKLEPDDVPALLARAQLRLAGREVPAAVADLDALDRIVPKQAEMRFALGNLYGRAGQLTSAIAQFDLWLPAHYEDVRRGEALAGRCRARALSGQDLKKALSDCSDALSLNSKAPIALDSRGLVRLRLGDYDKSIADYNAALALQPKLVWSLYGRGLDELHEGMRAEGQADIAAAAALQPAVVNEAKRLGLGP